jgi:hypothetical protein
MIALLNTFDRRPGSIGTVLSLHRSEAAAQQADRAMQRSVQRGHGRNAYLPTRISRLCAGRWRKGDDVRESEVI